MKKLLLVALTVFIPSLPSMMAQEDSVEKHLAETQALALQAEVTKLPKVSDTECSDTLRLWRSKAKQDRDWYTRLTVLEVVRLQSQARACSLRKNFAQRQEFDYWVMQFDLEVECALWNLIIEKALVSSAHSRPTCPPSQ